MIWQVAYVTEFIKLKYHDLQYQMFLKIQKYTHYTFSII